MGNITKNTIEGIEYIRRHDGDQSTVPLIFLHGIGSNAWSFAPLFEHLPIDLDLIAWHAPGYMGSKPLHKDWPDEEDYAKALKSFVDALGIDKAVIIGHSLGTLMGAGFANLYRDKVSQLILASCACGYGIIANDMLPNNVQSRLDDLENLGAVEMAKLRAKNLVYDPSSNQDAVALVESSMSKINLQGYTQATKMLASGQLEKNLENVKVPTNFIIGIQDQITPLEQTQRALKARQKNSGAGLIYKINNAGHAVYQQRPQKFITILQNLIDTNGELNV